MARTYRKKGVKIDRKEWEGTRSRGGARCMDKDMQRLPPRAARHDGFTVRYGYEDEFGGHSVGKALRLTERAHIREGMDSA